MSDFRARLVRFYEKYAADKLDGVDDLLAKSKGKEEKLFAKLVDKYGPEPEEENDTEEAASSAPAVVKEAKTGDSKKKKSSSRKAKTFGTRQNNAEEEEEEEEEAQTEPSPSADASTSVPATEATADDYGTRPWWKARLVRFYAKYVPEKTDADVEALLVKAKDNPVQLMKLFQMLEQKYGPEPDPSSDEEEEEDEDENHGAVEEEEEEEEAPNGPVDVAGLKIVTYCPIDGVPPEYSEYFDTFKDALPWLARFAPDVVLQTKGGKTVAEYAKDQGVEPVPEGAKVAKSDKAKERRRGGAKKSDGKIIIEMQERRKKAITTVKGLDGIEGIKMKDAAKVLGKKFAAGASVKDGAAGDEFIEIQGDFSYELPQVLLDNFSMLKKDQIYTVDADGKKQAAF